MSFDWNIPGFLFHFREINREGILALLVPFWNLSSNQMRGHFGSSKSTLTMDQIPHTILCDGLCLYWDQLAVIWDFWFKSWTLDKISICSGNVFLTLIMIRSPDLVSKVVFLQRLDTGSRTCRSVFIFHMDVKLCNDVAKGRLFGVYSWFFSANQNTFLRNNPKFLFRGTWERYFIDIHMERIIMNCDFFR